MSEIGIAESFEKGTAAKIAGLLSDLKKACTSIEDAIASVPSDDEAAMYFCRDTIIPAMNDAREAADTLETLVDRRFWPFPTYSELLFSER